MEIFLLLQTYEPVKIGPNQYACPLCSKIQKIRSDCIKHIRTHTGERPFQCPFCTYAASTQTHLARHNRTVHASMYQDLFALTSQMQKPQ